MVLKQARHASSEEVKTSQTVIYGFLKGSNICYINSIVINSDGLQSCIPKHMWESYLMLKDWIWVNYESGQRKIRSHPQRNEISSGKTLIVKNRSIIRWCVATVCCWEQWTLQQVKGTFVHATSTSRLPDPVLNITRRTLIY